MRVYTLLLIIYFFISCKNNSNSINAFRGELKRDLVSYINKGIFSSCGALENKIKQEISPNDVEKLLDSEHPLLRALASYLYISDDNFKLSKKFYQLLSDTGIVTDMACVCGQYQGNLAIGEIAARVFLTKDYFKDSKTERIHLSKLILNHPYLDAAFDQLNRVDYLEIPELYSVIQKMAQMNKSPEIKEKAIEALVRYNKPADMLIVFNFYEQNPNNISKSVFKFLTKNPNNTYIKILQKFARNYLYNYFSRDFLIEVKREAYLKCITAYDNSTFQQIFKAIWDMQNKDPMVSHKLVNQLNMLEIIKDNDKPFYKIFIRDKNMNTIQTALNEIKIIEGYEVYISILKNKERNKLLYTEKVLEEPPPPPPFEKKYLAKNWKIKALYQEFLSLKN